MTLTMVEVRNRLREIANDKGIPELHQIADRLVRKQRGPRSTRRTYVSPAQEQEIVDFAEANPEVGITEIGMIFGLNQGHISRIVYGSRQQVA